MATKDKPQRAKTYICNWPSKRRLRLGNTGRGKHLVGPKQPNWISANTAEGGTWKMPVLNEVPQFKYTITHEWGHHIDKGGSSISGQSAATTNAILRIKNQFPDAFKSEYGQTKVEEFYAEMFAEFYRNGRQNNK